MSLTAMRDFTLDQWFSTDTQLHHVYPPSIQLLARRHWTPLNITRMVVDFLVPHDAVKVLDIGSGVGKFCLAGAYYKPQASFFGVEQRKDLVDHAEVAQHILGLPNAHFIHGNLTQLNFKQYDHFYFYNSFYENLVDTEQIDDNIAYSTQLYNYYNRYLYKAMEPMPVGTRIATFHSLEDKLPACYIMVEAHIGNLLKFWMKV